MPQVSLSVIVLTLTLLLLDSTVYSAPYLSSSSLMTNTAYIDPSASSQPSNLNSSKNTPMPTPSLTAQWIPISNSKPMDSNNNNMMPRSGHVSFVLKKDHYVFGGYVEEEDERNGSILRTPSKELWKRTLVQSSKEEEQGIFATEWEAVGDTESEHWPEERLCSAVAVLNGRYVFLIVCFQNQYGSFSWF